MTHTIYCKFPLHSQLQLNSYTQNSLQFLPQTDMGSLQAYLVTLLMCVCVCVCVCMCVCALLTLSGCTNNTGINIMLDLVEILVMNVNWFAIKQ